jgi:hypothetical protein
VFPRPTRSSVDAGGVKPHGAAGHRSSEPDS